MFAKVVLFCGFGVFNLFGSWMQRGFGSISCARRSGVVLAAASNQVIFLSFLSVSAVCAAHTLGDDRSAGWTAV